MKCLITVWGLQDELCIYNLNSVIYLHFSCVFVHFSVDPFLSLVLLEFQRQGTHTHQTLCELDETNLKESNIVLIDNFKST